MSAPATTRVGTRWIALFALAWVGIWLAQLTPFQLTLPQQIVDVLHTRDDQWRHSVTVFGVVSGISAVCALVAFPLTGSLSDRTTGRFGRRRPWIAGGVVVFALGLVVLGTRHGLVGITVWWCVALTGFSAASAALTALIGDRVPVDQRGVVSSWVSAPQAIGVIVGVALIAVLGLGAVGGNLLAAVLLVLCVVPFLMTVDDPPHTTHGRGALSPRAVVAELWVSPRDHPDFGWTLLGRIAVNLGNALGTSLLLYFLQFGLRVPDADGDLLILTAVYMVFVIGAALASGVLSDRIGRRKPFVLAAGILQGLAALVIAVVASVPTTIAAAALLGAGFGSFLGVDQALATQVLPDPEHTGKDLGIMNIAMAVPQALGPLVGAGIVAATGGFVALFTASAVLGVAGGLSVLRVRSVR
ncbi:MFS transporter [Williamsia deligens]|uniref:MFS transporter n=1 Tax=Williamsia deligens TaxID=321325 RepID=A0ABW3G6E7_9NOCA|nr:MFS transporter [Williamsia deligens]MCP2194623.1 Na+/melibiose symporter [Williamsia deligens]